jgi:hypothetical protein
MGRHSDGMLLQLIAIARRCGHRAARCPGPVAKRESHCCA